MKKIILCLLLFRPDLVDAQHKISVDAYVDAGPAFNSSPSQEFTSTSRQVDSLVGGTYYYKQFTLQNTLRYQPVTKASFAAGIKASYAFSRNAGISLGMGFSTFTLLRTHHRTYIETGVQSLTFTPPNPYYIGMIKDDMEVMYLNAFTNERFNFTTLQFPASLYINASKWRFETGVTWGLITNSSRERARSFDPEIEFTNKFENEVSSTLSFTLSPSYRLNDKISMGVRYEHGLNDLVKNRHSEIFRTSPIRSRILAMRLTYSLNSLVCKKEK